MYLSAFTHRGERYRSTELTRHDTTAPPPHRAAAARLHRLLVLNEARVVLDAGARVEDKRDDEAVKTENLGENEDKDHADVEAGLLGRAADTGVTDDADGEAGGETGKTDGQAGAELDEAGVQGHGGLEATGDEDGDDEAVLRVSGHEHERSECEWARGNERGSARMCCG